jgi:hypothetical protein
MILSSYHYLKPKKTKFNINSNALVINLVKKHEIHSPKEMLLFTAPWQLKAGTVEKEKRPSLLGNSVVNTFLQQWINTQRWRYTWKWYFLCCPCQGYILRTSSSSPVRDPCGGGVEYLHCDPASRRRRRKGKSQIWDSKIWPRVLRDSDPKMTALARASRNCKQQTRPLVREGAPNQQTRNCQTIIKIWS